MILNVFAVQVLGWVLEHYLLFHYFRSSDLTGITLVCEYSFCHISGVGTLA